MEVVGARGDLLWVLSGRSELNGDRQELSGGEGRRGKAGETGGRRKGHTRERCGRSRGRGPVFK